YAEALAIYRRLADDRPQVYEPNLAGTLNNLGAVLSDLRELGEARDTYAEALAIRRRLAADRPQVYEPDLAGTLNNLGAVLSGLRELGEARDAYAEACSLYEKQKQRDWLEQADILSNWGLLEDEEGNEREALDRFQRAVVSCERGLGQLAESAHRDVFQ